LLVGIDFSPSQLARGLDYLADLDGIRLVHGDGARLPFPDRAFDLVLTSAVILHNPPPVAERMRREVVRVARRWAAHNEDTDVSYNRYGYDIAEWYRRSGIPLAECGTIPVDLDPASTRFCVADLGRP
jgi:ubiquinone/menaquinone biosynthesis C-methylase UbiE